MSSYTQSLKIDHDNFDKNNKSILKKKHMYKILLLNLFYRLQSQLRKYFSR